MNARLYLLQRVSAALMVPLIIGHVVVILYATARGVTAVDILSRTRGSVAWGLFYGAFVVAASIHAAIGLRTVLAEWGPRPLSRSQRALDAAMWIVGLTLLGLGSRAVFAVVSP